MKRYIVAGSLAAIATANLVNPATAQVRLPNGEITSLALVQLSPWYGQDGGDGSGAVLGSAHQAASGATPSMFTPETTLKIGYGAKSL